MPRLNEKDAELVLSGEKVDLSSNEYAYIGGEFLSDPEDYIEVLIYDLNENFLESSIVDEQDYLYNADEGIKLKTGTILRKMGYDRGNFVVKYNFFRKVAGSYENILVNKFGQIHTDEYDTSLVNTTGQIFDYETPPNQLMLKENKYFIHQISDSRKEIRLIPQSISDTKYTTDFYDIQRTVKREFSNGTAIQFLNVTNDSKDLQVDNAFTVEKKMEGGFISIPQAFITSYTPPPPVYSQGSPAETFEVIGETMVASFFAETVVGSSYKQYDTSLSTFFNRFSEFDTVETATNGVPSTTSGLSWQNGGSTIKMITKADYIDFKPPNMKTYKDKPGEVVLTSNSVLPGDVENQEPIATTYEWLLWGWDHDTSKNWLGQVSHHYRELDEGNDFEILSELDEYDDDGNVLRIWAQKDASNPYKAITRDSQSGCSLKLLIKAGDIRLGVMLTISNTLGTKTINYPCVIRSHWTESA